MEAAGRGMRDALGNQQKLPAGVSPEAMTKWKEREATAARRRLSELEDRLDRLHRMRSKLAQLKSNADPSADVQTHGTHPGYGAAGPGNWGRQNLPGQPDQALEKKIEPINAQGSLILENNIITSGSAQWSTFEDADGDLDSPEAKSPQRENADGGRNMAMAKSSMHPEEVDVEEIPLGDNNRMPSYSQPPYQPGMAPPFTPGFSVLRRIIRDEMSVDHAAKPPFTPGFSGLRTIIREEVAVTVSAIVSDELSQTSATIEQMVVGDATMNKTETRNTAVGKDPGAEDAEEIRFQMSDRQQSAQTRRAWTGRTDAESNYPDEMASPRSPLPMQESKVQQVPLKLDEAQERALPLLFGGFSRQSLLRMKCFQMMHSSSWTSFFYVNTLLSCIFNAIIVEYGFVGSNKLIQLELVELFFNLIFALEIMIGIIALGLIKGRTSWLRVSGMNVLDFIILMGTLAEYIADAFGYSSFTVKSFRILRILRVLCYFKTLSEIRSYIATLQMSGKQLLTVLMVILCILAAFSTLLLTFLRSNFARRCVVVSPDVSRCSSDFSTGWASPSSCNFKSWRSTIPNVLDPNTPDQDFPVMIDDSYPFERWCKVQRNTSEGQYDGDPDFDLDFKGRYHTCGQGRPNYRPGSEMCVEIGNPESGFSHYDDVGGSLVTLAQGAALDSYYNILWRSFQSEPYWAGGLFAIYFSMTLLVTWVMISIFIAVITGTFKMVRDVHVAEDEADKKRKELRDLDYFEQNGHGHYHFWESKSARNKQDAKLRRLIASRHNNSGHGKVTTKFVEFQNGDDFVHEFDADISENAMPHQTTYIDEKLAELSKNLLKHPRYPHVSSMLILAHCFAMSCDQFDAPPVWREYAYWSYVVLNLIFLTDLVVRIFAAEGDYQTFFSEKINIFETAMVVVGIIGLIGNGRFLMLIPAARLYRLMRYLPTLQNLLILATGSMKPLINLLVFIQISSLAVAVTGRSVFGERMDFTRSNFSSFPEAMVTVFQLLIGDSWSGVVYSAMFSMTSRVSMFFAGIFILTWFIFSSLIISNLFVAVIIENFEIAETMDSISKDGHIAALRRSIQSSWQTFWQATAAVARGDVQIDVDEGGRAYDPMEQSLVLRNMESLAKKTSDQDPKPEINQTKVYESSPRKSSLLGKQTSFLAKVIKRSTVQERAQEAEEHILPESVLFCISPDSRIRTSFQWLGKQQWFDVAIYLSILMSCIFLTLIPPSGLDTESILRIDPEFNVPLSDRFTRMATYTFTFVFTTEFFVKVLDRGLLFTKRAYLKDPWNLLDTGVLIVSLTDVIISFMSLDSFKGGKIGKVLRLARALRPMRLLKRNQSMRAVIDALFATLVPVGYVLLFLLWTMLVFSLMGMGLFSGMFHFCSTQDLLNYSQDPAVAYPGGKRECVGYFVRDDGVLIQRAWDTPPYHFDTFLNSIKTLNVVSTFKVVNVMHHSFDITEFNFSPRQNATLSSFFFFALYIFIGGLFVMNLFVGFIVDGFNYQRGSSDVEVHYNKFVRQLTLSRPRYNRFQLPQNNWSRLCRELTGSRVFQTFSATCIAVNVIFNLTDNRNASDYFDWVINVQNEVFNYVLFVEVFLAFIGYGPGNFLDDKWKLFDAIVATGALVGMVYQSHHVTKFSKAFRLTRILRLMIMFRPIRMILETLIAVWLEIINILVLLLLVYAIFAVMGMQLFGMVKPGLRAGATASFYSFENSMLTIFQVVTGDEWHILMHDHKVQYPSCTEVFNEETVPGWTAWKGKPLQATDCGGEVQTVIYWTLTKLLCDQVLLNLFIGVILENFSFIADEATHIEDERWSSGPSARQVQQIVETFQRFDQRQGSITLSAVHSFLCSAEQPVGFRRSDGTLEYGSWERAAEKVIEAELNVIVRSNRLERQNSLRNKLLRIVRMQHLSDTGNRAEFDDVVKTCVFWRKPKMIPLIIRKTRGNRVEEVTLMAYALVICRAFKTILARKIMLQYQKEVSALRKFKQWERMDEVRQRRAKIVILETETDKKLAEQEKTPMHSLHCNPTQSIRVVLECVSDVPDDIIDHQSAVRANKTGTNTLGALEIFRSFAKNHLIAMKFLDPRHEDFGFVLVDFTKQNFDGWEVINTTTTDTFLMPQTRMTFNPLVNTGTSFVTRQAQFIPQAWTKIDVVVMKGNTELACNHKTKLGSLTDIQSYVHTGGQTNDEKIASATYRVRCNLGVLRVDRIARDISGHGNYLPSAQRQNNEIGLVEESVLEVVGYIPLQ